MRVAAIPLILLACAAMAPAPRGVSALRDPARLVEMGREAEARDPRQAATFYDLALSADGTNIPALSAAGGLALRRGDGPAAFAYYTALTRIAPGNAGAHFGLGAALILRLQPAEALGALAMAERLGAPISRIGSQRGLAYDLLGEFRSAQVAYAGALAAEPTNLEIGRRLALSLAVSGSRPAALQVLRRFESVEAEAVPLRQTMALVYALTGDAPMADEIAASILPAAQARQMSAFFAALPALNPRDKVMAAMFGRLPDGQAPVVAASRAVADVTPTPTPPAPQRLWVQVANVSDPGALAAQWASIVRSGKGASDLRNPRTAQMATGNKLLVGPFASRSAANDAVLRLKQRGVASFPVTTPRGQQVTDLDGAVQ